MEAETMRRPDPDQQELLDQLADETVQSNQEPWAAGYVTLTTQFPEEWKEAKQQAMTRLERSMQEQEVIADELGTAADNAAELAPRVARELLVPDEAELRRIRVRLGRKFQPSDLTAGMKEAAREFVRAYEGDFEFMADLKRNLTARGTLSDGQCKGALNVLTADRKFPDGIVTVQSPIHKTDPAPRVEAPSLTEEGFYSKDGDIFKVQRSAAGRLYALVLTRPEDRTDVATDPVLGRERKRSGKFEYAQGAVFQLTPEDKLSLEEAQEYGKRFGHCCICGRTLTDPVSVAEGIGPVCSGKVAWR